MTANTALTTAKNMENAGALVYTVGVFDGANSSVHEVNPNDVSTKFNAFMNGVSSNYPDAVSYTNLGERASNLYQYYKPAADADELDRIFTEIAEEINTKISGSPITSSGGGESYVTFNDELGQYMQVDDVKSIVFANTQYTQSEKTEDKNNNKVTYVFESEIDDPNGIFPNGNLNEIKITVQKGDTLAQGDKVEVKIPAKLLPMRNYKASVDKNGKVTWDEVTPAYPIRVFYGVSLKNGVADAIKNGTADEALKTYVAVHTASATDAAGEEHEAVSFLSNKYESGEDGTTTATFTPAKTNGYYYVDQYTPLYVDEACRKPLTEEIWNREHPQTFYYQQTVYQEDENEPKTIVQSFPVSTFAEGVSDGIVIQGKDGAYGLAAGSPRLSRIRDLLDVKGEGNLGSNDTTTANNIADPNWDHKNADAKQITVNLGNNGKMFVELPGQLRVSKTVKVGEKSGLDKSQFANKEFSFTIHVDGMAGKTVKAQVVKTDGGAEVAKPFDIKFDESGNYTHSIKDGETLVIDGLNDKAEYTVTENLAEAKGFTSSSEAESGVISSTEAATAAFTNTYAANPATDGGFTAVKSYVDDATKKPMADWDGATFDFVLEAVPGTTDGNGSRDVFNNPITNVADIPMPGESKDGKKQVTVSNDKGSNFGGISYTKPGKYVYRIWEESPSKDDSDWRAGVDYSSAVYIAVVVVKDNGEGGLTVDTNESTLYMRINDDGQNTNKTEKVSTAVITNTYHKGTAPTNFLATKNWTDNSGGNVGLTEGQFKFVVKAVPGVAGNDGKVTTGSYDASGNPIAEREIPMPAGENPMGNDGTSVAWGFIEFTNDMNGNHYFYDLYEEQPTKDGTYKGEPFDGAKKDEATGKWVYRGVTYDNEVYTAEVVVGVDVKDDKTQQTYTHVIYRDSKGKEVHQTDGAGTAERVPFSNSYAVNPVTGDSTLDGQKTLDGRVMKQGETFFFSLTQMAGPSDGVTGLKNKATVTGDGNKTVDVFNFGTPTFTKPGTYTFQIRETKADGENFTDADNIDGMKYDTHTATVTYVVNDTSEDNTILHTGNLRVANVTYNNENAQTAADQKATDKAPFTNFYTASATFGGIQVSKTLTGRDMKAGEFDFTITRDGDEGPEPSKSDASFGNAQDRTSGIADVMTKLSGFKFTQADAGKTYTYIVDEAKPSDKQETDLPGVTYDATHYRVSISIADDGDGTMTVTSTIVKIDEDGQAVGDAVPVAAFNNVYAPAASDAVTPKLNKVLSGRNWTADDRFTFDIEKVSLDGKNSETDLQKMPMPKNAEGAEVTNVTLNADGSLKNTASDEPVKFDFGSLTFTQAGTYVYQVIEQHPDNAVQVANGWLKDGITYTNRVITITIKVTDDTTTGKLVVDAPEISNRGTFYNTYAASQNFDDAVNFQLTKRLNGHAMRQGQFSFKVEALDGKGTTAKETAARIGLEGGATSDLVPGGAGDAGQKVVMMAGNQKMGFDHTDSGKTFKLQFSEVQPDLIPAGYTYDNATYTLEITPTDLGDGKMSIVTKVTKAWKDAESNDKSEETTYEWNPNESNAAKDQVSLDFANTYTSEGTVAIEGTKKIEGPWTGDKAGFTFEIKQVKDANGTALTDDDGIVRAELPTPATATSDAEGKFKFEGIKFTKPGDYYFQITETAGKAGNGWTNSTEKPVVKVTVEEADKGDGNGKLTATVDTTANLTFTNTYAQTASDAHAIQVKKTVKGHDADAGNFSFELIADDAAKAAIESGAITGVNVDNNGLVSTESNKAIISKDGTETISFAGMTFTKATTDEGYTFTVKEVVKDDADGNDENRVQNDGWTMDTHEYKVNIKVVDKDSKLTVEATPVDESSDTFENTYAAEGQLALAGTKALRDSANNDVPLNGREWTFKLDSADEATKAAIDAGVVKLPSSASTQNKANGTFDFGSIAFKSTGAASVDYKFKVTESGDVPGVTNDSKNERTITVRVTDDGKGNLTAALVDGSSDNLNFVNTYGVDSEAQLEIKGAKTLAGDFSTKPDITNQYTFTLSAVDGAPLVAGDNFGNDKTNPDANGGTVSFGNLKFSMADLAGVVYKDGVRSKEFTYKVTEAGGVPGVTNDSAATTGKTFKIKLTDDGKGNLNAELVGHEDGNAFAFTNTYAPGSTTNAPAGVQKRLTGDRGVALQDGEFSFAMSVAAKAGTDTPEDGFTMPDKTTAANKADGSVTFDNIIFTKVGTYTVTVEEQVPANADKAPYMTYDDHSYTYDVVVTADGTGSLKAEVKNESTANGGKVFTNTYKKPEQKKDAYLGDGSEPKTNINGQMVGVGDLITYEIDWSNDAVDDSGKSIAAEITVTDKVPAGTEFVSASNGGTQQTDGSVKWELGKQNATATGTVTMTVKVTDDAVTVDKIANKATITIGDHNAETNEVTNTTPKKTVGENRPTVEGPVQVGDELTYTISWANTTGEAAKVTVKDVLSDGLTFVSATEGGSYDKASRTVTWDLGNKKDGDSGTVQVTVRVNEDAVKVDANNSNKATIQVGDKSSFDTNTVPDFDLKTGGLSISKTVNRYDEGTAAPDDEFTFTVELQDKNGAKLTGEYNFTGTSDGASEYKGTIKSGETIKLKANGAITIAGLPDGASYRVTEAGIEGAAYQVSYNNTWFDVLAEGENGAKGNEVNDATNVGFIAADKTATVAVTNTYAPEHMALTGAENLKVQKVLEGRDWLANEKYTFEISAVTEGAPLPENKKLELGKPADGNTQAASFGDIRFAKAGTYEYKIVETGKSADSNLSFSKAEYKVVVTVTPENGALNVSSVMTQVKSDEGKQAGTEVSDNTAVFTNTYTKPEQKKDVAKADDPKASIDGKLVGVGDELAYTIDWVNDAVNDKGEAVKAEVTIKDEVPAGTELVKDSITGEGELGADGKTITWELGEQDANASGTVSFKVKVTDAAVDVDKITNQAKLTIGDHKAETNVVTNDFPKKTVQTPADGSVKVGDILTYTVEWANTTGETADVVVSDTFVKGLSPLLKDGDITVTGADGKEVETVASSPAGSDETTVKVTIKSVDAGTSGTVVFKARVTEDALTVDKLTNKATIAVGDKSSVMTNTTTTPAPGKGNLTVSKTVTAGEGGVVDGKKEFEFTVTAKDASNYNLNGTYGDLTFKDGKATFKLNNGDEKTISGLPEGAQYEVVETPADGYTTTITDDDGNVSDGKGTIASGATATEAFTNAYSSAVPTDKPVKVDGLLAKEFTGRTWSKGDEFTFKVVPGEGAPMPDGVEADGTVTVKGDGESETQPINLGTINFTFDDIKGVAPDADGKRTKTFTYDISEVVPEGDAKLPGVDYDEHHATLTVTLTDDGKGNLTGESSIAAVTRVANGAFHNVYTSEVDYTATSGVQLQKTLNGRDMTDGQFAFTLSNFSEGAQEKLGLSSDADAYKVTAAAAGKASTINLFAGKSVKFTNEDEGKTYSFDVTETKKGTPEADASGNGYTNDATEWHVAIAVTYDKATGVLTVTTTATADGKETVTKVVTSDGQVSDGTAVIPFTNSYEASTEKDGGTAATIEVKKELTGRPLEAGEFTYTLTGPDGKKATAQNDADGNISFGTFNYKASELDAMVDGNTVKRITTEDGKRGWELSYTATESTKDFADKGLTANRQSFPVTVTVVDNGDGSLTANVSYPAEDKGGNVFKNTYNASEITLSLNGKKFLEHADNLTPNSIEGKFTFTLTDEAGNKIAEAKNDANGNVSFPNVLTYTLDAFNKEFGITEDEGTQDKTEEGVDAQVVVREHTYTYYVEETGSAPGVTNDATAKKVIQVKVTDDGEGHLTAQVVKDDQTLDFTFTNTYTVQPVASSITDQLSIGKTIVGREMQAGEFDFVLVDAEGNTVAAGDNDQAGTSSKVTFTPIQFTEPGEYDYTVRELNSGKGGVGYDGTSYQAHASVKDNGDGTLSVTWTFSKGDAAGDESATEGVVFKNTYTAKPTSITFNAAKVLTGRDLKAGEFTFQLREDGKVLQTVKNGVDGDVKAIKFDAITYDKVGEHDYEIVEVKGKDANVTYDKTVFTYHVSVTDDGNGSLVATWTVGEAGEPVFHNVYTEPAKPEPKPEPEPEEPAKPSKPELPQTGDSTPPTGVLATIAAFGAALVGGGVALIKRRR